MRAVLLTIFAIVAIYGCGGSGVPTNTSQQTASKPLYVGTVERDGISLHFRVEDTNLLLILENTSQNYYSNIAHVVAFETVSGDAESYGHINFIDAGGSYLFELPIPPFATGLVNVDVYSFASKDRVYMDYSSGSQPTNIKFSFQMAM